MIVKTGKHINIEVFDFFVERSCEAPGTVKVTCRNGQILNLPGNVEDAERFISAYRRAITEDIPYHESKVE